jgi:hypothetical protein
MQIRPAFGTTPPPSANEAELQGQCSELNPKYLELRDKIINHPNRQSNTDGKPIRYWEFTDGLKRFNLTKRGIAQDITLKTDSNGVLSACKIDEFYSNPERGKIDKTAYNL